MKSDGALEQLNWAGNGAKSHKELDLNLHLRCDRLLCTAHRFESEGDSIELLQRFVLVLRDLDQHSQSEAIESIKILSQKHQVSP